MGQHWTYGGVISLDPLIVMSKRIMSMGTPLGLLSASPNLFDGRPSISFLTLSWSHESPKLLQKLVSDVQISKAANPLAEIVMCANTDREHELFESSGIPSILANENSFCELARYNFPEERPASDFDAVYVASLHERKRHFLANRIPNLLCLYDKAPTETVDMFRDRLPFAAFGNHDWNDDQYERLFGAKLNETMARAHVGLCLSASEGAMRVSVEYQLCGLPVVTTPSKGGRDRYLQHEFAKYVDPNPEVVAEAVQRLKNRGLSPKDIRQNVIDLIERDRDHFVREANKHIDRVFGAQGPQISGFDPFERTASQRMRPMAEVLKPTLA